MAEHLVYSVQNTDINTWVTPARAVAVNEATFDSDRAAENQETTGSGRDPYLFVLGAKPVVGSINVPWWTANIATFFYAFMRNTATSTPAGATNARDHGFLYDDEAAFYSLAIQKIYRSTLARNVLGFVPNAVNLSFTSKEAAKIGFEGIAKDIARAGQNWDSLGTPSEAVITSPTYPAVRRSLYYYDAVIATGGTPSLNGTTRKISISGSTTTNRVHNIQIAINHNLDTDAFTLMRDPTVFEIEPGSRTMDVTFEMSWSDYATSFYDAAHAGTPMALDVNLRHTVAIESGFFYEGHVIVPSVFFDPMKLPPISGDKKRKTVTLTGHGQQDPTTGVGLNVWIRSAETSIS